MAKKLKEYYDEKLLHFLAEKILNVKGSFNTKSFIKSSLNELKGLELKDRIKLIGKNIHENLEGQYPEQIKILEKILGDENLTSFGTFYNYFWQWCLSSVVEQYGLEYKRESMDFIYKLTKRSTGEFAIRPFLIEDPQFVFKKMKKWSQDDNFHVRRLSSEGLRPLLPWAKKCTHFIEKPEPVFKLLKSLNHDSDRYVVNSVANHMGDMLKLNYEAAMNELLSWSDTDDTETKWLIRHSVRNLRKKENKEAMELTERMK